MYVEMVAICGPRLAKSLGRTLEIAKTQKIENTFKFTKIFFGQEFTQLLNFLFCLFIFQENEEYLVSW